MSFQREHLYQPGGMVQIVNASSKDQGRLPEGRPLPNDVILAMAPEGPHATKAQPTHLRCLPTWQGPPRVIGVLEQPGAHVLGYFSNNQLHQLGDVFLRQRRVGMGAVLGRL